MSEKADNPTILEKLRSSWVEYLHAIYVVGVIGGWYFTSFLDPTEFKARVMLIAILVYFVILLLFLGYFIHAYSRKARYAEATACVHQAVHELRDTSSYLTSCLHGVEKYELAEVKTHIATSLESVSRAYSIVTGTNCRVSVKILGGSDRAYVKTLARDSASARTCHEKDKAEGKRHMVVKNTDYNLILNAGRSYFFCNNIPSSREYTNTSKDEYGEKLPYAAAIVLPIRSVDSQQSEGAADRYRCLGFLTVDSSARNAFLEKYDVQLGAIIADTLYPVMDLLAITQQAQSNAAH